MKKFIICAHTFPTYGGTTRFVRTIPAMTKELAIKVFFAHFGKLNAIDRIVEVKENGELY